MVYRQGRNIHPLGLTDFRDGRQWLDQRAMTSSKGKGKGKSITPPPDEGIGNGNSFPFIMEKGKF